MAFDKVFNAGLNCSKIEMKTYVASDISDMMNKGAIAFHPKTKILASLAPTIKDLVCDLKENLNMKLAMFYGLGVSVRYAIRNASDYIAMSDVCNLQVYNRISFCRGKTRTNVYGTGKTVYIISLNDFIEGLKLKGLFASYCTANMQHNKDGDNSLRVSLVIGHDEAVLDSFMAEYNRCIDICNKGGINIEMGSWKSIESLLDEKQD